MDVQRLGILALGGFVGFLLGLGLMNSHPTLKAAITVIGTALGGAPVVFISEASDKWMYPLGLLTGLLWSRAVGARVQLAQKVERPAKQAAVHGWLAWIDLLLILAITIGAVSLAFATKHATLLEQSGTLKLMTLGEQEVFYAQPFQSTPNLTFSKGEDNPEEFRIIEQRSDGFKVKVGGAVTAGTVVEWHAQGRPAQ
jgi:hypothetical protein